MKFGNREIQKAFAAEMLCYFCHSENVNSVATGKPLSALPESGEDRGVNYALILLVTEYIYISNQNQTQAALQLWQEVKRSRGQEVKRSWQFLSLIFNMHWYCAELQTTITFFNGA